MTSKERRILESGLHRELTNEVLTSTDPEIWINRHGMEMSLGIAMSGIDEYIRICFWLNDNPLRHLRGYFPGFSWKFHEDVRRDKLQSVLGVTDYIWVTGLQVGDGIVTATQVGGSSPRLLCFLSEEGDHSGWNRMIGRGLSNHVADIRFVRNGNARVAGTIVSR